MHKIACGILLLVALPAMAEVQIGPTYSIQKSERLTSDTGAKITAGGDWYLWGSYQHPGLSLVGQSMASVRLLGGGLGFRHEFGAVSLFGEFGYFDPSVSTIDRIRNEAVVTALVGDHGPIPFHPEHTVYRLQPDYGGRLGVSYAVSQRIGVSLAYRALKVREGFDACTGPDPGCRFPVDGSHWQNRQALDLSAVEFSLFLRFGHHRSTH